MTLRQHIDNEYKGNIAAFARSIGVSHTQVSRWLEYGATWTNGQAHKQLSNINYDAPTFEDLNDFSA